MKTKFLSTLLLLIILTIETNGQNYPALDSYNKYPFNFRALEELSTRMDRNDTLKPFYQNGKFLYLNTRIQKNQSQEQYDEAYPYYKQYAVVKKNGRYGIINRQGKFVVEPTFTDFYFDAYPEGIMFNIPNMLFTFSDGKLENVNGFLGEEDPYIPPIYIYQKGKKYGVRFKDDKKIKPVYDSILYTSYQYIIAKKTGKFGVIDTAGNIIMPFKYIGFLGSGRSSYANYFALQTGLNWCYYLNLKLLFKSNYQPVELNQNKLIFKIDSFYNYFNDAERIILSKNYKWISGKSCLALNANNELIFLNSKNEEFIYYNPITKSNK